jgi:hypothetical protein
MNNLSPGTQKFLAYIFAFIGAILALFLLVILFNLFPNFMGLLVILALAGYKIYSSRQTLQKPHIRKPRKIRPKHPQYEDSRLTDYMMQRIMKAYNVKEEPSDSDEETSDEDELYEETESEFNEELDEEVVEEADEYTESPTSYGSRNEKVENNHQPVLYNGYDDSKEEKTGLRALISPVQLPITISIFWLFAILAIYKFIPEISRSFSKFISPSILVVLPVLFLFGLSGFLGILLKQPSESLETASREKASYILNVSKMFIGWGLSIYIFITNIFN